ncbi:Rossmann-fold NAD(P)-binding domain-containing protein [Rhodococcus opacus]|uniref:hypothetical protein n=1 Tax=Rhodococcus opacus TaxID=37919 RepID=UPI0038998DBD
MTISIVVGSYLAAVSAITKPSTRVGPSELSLPSGLICLRTSTDESRGGCAHTPGPTVGCRHLSPIEIATSPGRYRSSFFREAPVIGDRHADNLDGKVEIETGDTSGIGRAAVHEFVAEGANVTVAENYGFIGKLNTMFDLAGAWDEQSALIGVAKGGYEQPHRQSPALEGKQLDRWENEGGTLPTTHPIAGASSSTSDR